MSLPLMIFAAGRGTRMGALGADRPKALLPIAGRPLLDHALGVARSAQASPIVINTHHHGEQIVAHLKGAPDIILSHEPDLLETGGGLKAARPLLGPGPAFTLNADAVWKGPNPFAQLAAAFAPAEMDALLLLVPTSAALASGPGDFFLEGGKLRRRGAGATAPFIYTGAQIIRPDLAEQVQGRSFSMNIIWDHIIASGRAYGLVMQGGWRDVGTPEALAAAETWLAAP